MNVDERRTSITDVVQLASGSTGQADMKFSGDFAQPVEHCE